MLAKIIFTSFIMLIAGCKQSSVSYVSDATTDPGTELIGACVVYEKQTKEVQATCFSDRTQESCNKSFKMMYEDVAPGKYEKELVLKTDCTDAKLKVAERLAKDSTSTGIVEKGKCVCGGFVQKKANLRYCLVARKLENAKWLAVAQLPLVADCKTQCDASAGLAAGALASAACKE
jgi:hypothetical protein